MPRSKKRKSSKVTRLPDRQTTPSKQALDRKLSEAIKEIAVRLLKEPGADVATEPAMMAVLMLAGAAWNGAIGDSVMRAKHRELVEQIDWSGVTPWFELKSDDTDQLIAESIEYKRQHYPDDQRRVVATELTPDGNVRVHWTEPSTVVTGSSAPRAREPGRPR